MDSLYRQLHAVQHAVELPSDSKKKERGECGELGSVQRAIWRGEMEGIALRAM
jgi:hypothetical protein